MTQTVLAGILLAAHGVAAALLLVLLAARAHAHHATRVRTAVGLAVVALTGAAIFARIHPASISPDWITVLHEGNSLRVIRNLHGARAHAGPGYRVVMDALAAGDHPDIRDVVRANLWLAVLAATLVWGIARERSGRVGAAWIAAPLFALNPVAVNATLSELPSMLLAVEMLATLVAVAVALDPQPARLWVRRVAVGEILLLGVIAATTRAEMLLLFVPVTAALAGHLVGGPELVLRADEALLAAVHRALASSRPRNLLLAAMLLAIPLAGVLPGDVGWMLAWANPLEPRALALPLALAECLPWGVIALAMLGGGLMARRPVRWLLFPWALLGLARLYGRASHGAGFEMLRYSSMLLAPVVLLAVEGWRAIEAIAASRRWSGWWRAPAGAALAATWLMPPAIGTSRSWPEEAPPDPRKGANVLLLHRVTQVELRWLMRRVDAEPRCAFISRAAAGGRYDDRAPRWSWVVFGHAMPRLIELPLERPAAVVLREAAPEATCLRFYRSVDCELPGADGCAADVGDAPVVEEATLTVLPYSDPGEYGQLPPIVRLGVYDLGGTPPPPQRGTESPGGGPSEAACDEAVSDWAALASRRASLEISPVSCTTDRVVLEVAGSGCNFEVTHGPGFQRTEGGAFGVSPIADLDWGAAPQPMKRGLAAVLSALTQDPSLPIGVQARRPRGVFRASTSSRGGQLAAGAGVAAICLGAVGLWWRRRKARSGARLPAPPSVPPVSP